MTTTTEARDTVSWSVAGQFLEALAGRDYPTLAATLAPSARFRAMLPRGPVEWEGADVIAGAFGAWFGQADEFEVLEATIGEVGGRLHLSWRLGLRPAPIGDGWHVVEQQAYVDVGTTIEAIDLVCSGFQPVNRPA